MIVIPVLKSKIVQNVFVNHVLALAATVKILSIFNYPCRHRRYGATHQVDKFYGSKKVSMDVPKWKMIASHTARRTFITLSLNKGVPEYLIMQVTGIKSLKTLQGYIRYDKKFNKTISEAWD